MKVPNYLPRIYESNLEMQSLAKAEENEFKENLKPAIRTAFDNTFVITSNEQGVEQFEKLFSIIADTSTETLEFRKERLLNRLISQTPFTEKYLQERLDMIIGKNINSDFTPYNENNDYWYYKIDYNNYELNIFITMPGRNWLNELYNFCEKIIPCNIDWNINIYAAIWNSVKEHFATWDDVKGESNTWQDIMDGEWLL